MNGKSGGECETENEEENRQISV